MVLGHDEDFVGFVRETEPKLRRALVAAAGGQRGREAACEALEFAWEHWDRVKAMDNPAGYLYRVGRSRAFKKPQPNPVPLFPDTLGSSGEMPWVEPGLPGALAGLTEKQRVAVLLVHGQQWTLTEVAGLLSVTPGAVQKHAERGLAKLRRALGGLACA